MPYKSKYNTEMAEQVCFLSPNHVNRAKEINDFATNYEMPSEVGGIVGATPSGSAQR